MFIKPSKKWRNPVGDDSIMVPYTYYHLCESFRDADGKTKQRTVLGLGELLDFPTSEQKQELADLLTEMINDGSYRQKDKVDIALVQIIARAIYPYSEYRTVRYLQENSAVCEMFGLDPERITKDTLYHSAHSLYRVHKEMEDYLHRRVCSLFNVDEKILLVDLTNTYFEGRMSESTLCKRGRSKEKRDDCKIVVLAAVVNKECRLVRTEIFEGNRQDVSTLEEVIGSLEKDMPKDDRHLIVMDAGFSSKGNLQWLRDNGYDFITVMRSSGTSYTTDGPVKTIKDNKEQTIRLQMAHIEGVSDTIMVP